MNIEEMKQVKVAFKKLDKRMDKLFTEMDAIENEWMVESHHCEHNNEAYDCENIKCIDGLCSPITCPLLS